MVKDARAGLLYRFSIPSDSVYWLHGRIEAPPHNSSQCVFIVHKNRFLVVSHNKAILLPLTAVSMVRIHRILELEHSIMYY